MSADTNGRRVVEWIQTVAIVLVLPVLWSMDDSLDDLALEVAQIATKVDAYASKADDHETRIRALEGERKK